MRQAQRRAVIVVILLRKLNGGTSRGMRQHVGKRCLLAADEQQRQEQGKKWVQEAAHGARITTQDAPHANQSTCSSKPFR